MNYYQNIELNATYKNGKGVANIATNNNGKQKVYNIKFNNNDLDNILNIQSVEKPLHKRLIELYKDFKNKKHIYEPKFIEFENTNNTKQEDQNYIQDHEEKQIIDSYSLNKNKQKPFYTHISSPLQNEEFLIPISINKKINQKPQSLYRYKNSSKKNKSSSIKHKLTKRKRKQKKYITL